MAKTKVSAEAIAESKRGFDELVEYFYLQQAHYLEDSLWKEGDPYPGPKLERLFDLEQKYSGVETRQIILDAYLLLFKAYEEIKNGV